MAEDFGGQSVLNVGDINHSSGLEAVTLEDLKVVSVRPLAGSTVAVVCVVLDGEVVLSSPLKVREADHLLELGELSGGKIADDDLETSVGLLEERTSSHGPREEGAGKDLSAHCDENECVMGSKECLEVGYGWGIRSVDQKGEAALLSFRNES